MQMIPTPKEKQMTRLPAKEMEIVGQWTKSDKKKYNLIILVHYGVKLFIVDQQNKTFYSINDKLFMSIQ